MVETLQDQPVTITLTGSDPDLDPLTFRVVGGPANGTVTGTTSIIEYTPGPGFVGLDEVYFVADDGVATSSTATVTIDVKTTAQPDAGVADSGAAEDSGTVVPERDGGATAPTRDAGTTAPRDAGKPSGEPDPMGGDEGCDCRDVRGASSASSAALLTGAVVVFLFLGRPHRRRVRRARVDRSAKQAR
jgi:hypothetical protein